MTEGKSVRAWTPKSRLPAVRMKLRGDDRVALRTLSVNDVAVLTGMLGLPPIELALQILAHQAEDLPDALAVLGELPRPTLLRLARTWASQPGTFGAAPNNIRSFDAFKTVAVEKVDEWERPIRELSARLSRSIAPAIIPVFPAKLKAELVKIEATSQCITMMVEQQVGRITDELTKITDEITASFRANLPDLSALQKAVDEAKKGKEHLDIHGYGFAVFDASLSGLRQIARERPDSRKIHRAFLERSRDPDFGLQLIGRVTQSSSLARREADLRAALKAHVNREYALSVPCLYAQLEGILTDLLVIEGLARRRGMKAFPTAGTNELVGLKKKAHEYGQKAAPMRDFVTASILGRLSAERNAVLHGSKTSYLQANRSARLLLLVDALTHLVVSTETPASGK
jgi:hypothetical protein